MVAERLHPELPAADFQPAQPDAASRLAAAKNRAGTIMLWQRLEHADDTEVPPMPPDPLAYGQKIMNPPQLEAEPMHEYPATPHESDDREPLQIEPLSVETHQSTAPMPAVAALERIKRKMTSETAALPKAAKQAGSKAAQAAMEAARPRTAQSPETLTGATSERQLGKRELLSIAKDITIDGVRLKDVYTAKRIDEAGLRAVVEVYLRGGDIKQQLSREITIKEQSYERDPQLRHQRHKVGQVVGQAVNQAKDIASEHGAKLLVSSQETAKKASRVITSGAKQAQHDIIDTSNIKDWLGITAVVVVYSIILLLWISSR